MGWGELKCGLWGILFGQVEVKFKALEKKHGGERQLRQINTDAERQRERERKILLVCVCLARLHVFNM